MPVRTFFQLACVVVLSVGIQPAFGESQPKQDRAWKQYSDKQAGYCVSYPSRWIKARGFEGGGFSVTTGVTRYSMPIASLDVTAVADDTTEVHTTPVSLSIDYESHIYGLKKFIRAERVENLEQRQLAVSGSNGLFAKDSYFDPKEKADWVEEIVFVRQNGVMYRLELQTRSKAVGRFEPVFQHFVQSFQMGCSAGRLMTGTY